MKLKERKPVLVLGVLRWDGYYPEKSDRYSFPMKMRTEVQVANGVGFVALAQDGVMVYHEATWRSRRMHHVHLAGKTEGMYLDCDVVDDLDVFVARKLLELNK